MTEIETAPEGAVSAVLMFPAGFVGFAGHFPGNPILPGVCQVQAGLMLATAACGTELSLREIVNAKFFQPILPGMRVEMRGRLVAESDGNRLLKAQLTGPAGKLSDLSLRLAPVDGGSR
jgi:3-hydroxymyristoyl/3-hydroxydecanoyl-(acyl carrier protein) dehydratase